MSTVADDKLTGAKVSVSVNPAPADEGSSVVEEERDDDEVTSPTVRKLLAAAATASNGLLLMLSLSNLGYIRVDFLN